VVAAMAEAVAVLAVVVAMRGERRVPLRVLGEVLDGTFFEAPRRRRLLPSFLGVLRMLKAIDWRLSACGGASVKLGDPSHAACCSSLCSKALLVSPHPL
jgi:hypothetical protein